MTNPKQKYLEDVEFEKSLKLSNGKTVLGLEQLPMIVKFSDEEVFLSHVTDQKNDFANWIRDVIGYGELADKIKGIRSKDEFIKVIDQEISGIKNFKEPEIKPAETNPSSGPSIPAALAPSVSSSFNSAQSAETPLHADSDQPPQQHAVAVSENKLQENKDLKKVADTPKQDIQSPAAAVQPVPSVQSVPPNQSGVQSTPVGQSSVQSVQQTSAPVQQTSSPVQSSAPTIQTQVQPPQSDQKATVDASANPSMNPSVPSAATAAIEEKFDYEEIFKVLMEELEQETYAWENGPVS